MTITIYTQYQGDSEQYWYAENEESKVFGLFKPLFQPITSYGFYSKEALGVNYKFPSLEDLKKTLRFYKKSLENPKIVETFDL